MPMDTIKFREPARRGDVAGVAIQTTVALRMVESILRKPDMAEEERNQLLTHLDDCIKKLDRMFDDLVGWTDEP